MAFAVTKLIGQDIFDSEDKLGEDAGYILEATYNRINQIILKD